MKKLAIAASSVALAAMPVVGVFAADTAQDSITVSITPSCTFTTGGSSTAETGTYTYTGTNADGVKNLTKEGGDNVHSFTVFCNNNAGYHVNATATDLTQTGVNDDKFTYAASLPSSGTDGAWHAEIAADTGLTVVQLPASTQGSATAKIISLGEASGSTGESFTATYSAYIGTETPAGTYSGTISYTLDTGA